MCYVTLLGGFNTTANTIALGTAALALHPDAADFIRQGGATDGVLMELMRFIAMSTTVPRIAKEDFEWRGHEVKQGQYVFLMLAGANRDPTVFDKPDTLDVERSEQRNMVFAPGLHFCVGHYFAKVQLAEFFSELLQRYHVTLLDDRLDFGPALAFRGVESLNVRLTPRAR
jgi:cytochrome P450